MALSYTKRRDFLEQLRQEYGDDCWLCKTKMAFHPDHHPLGRATLDHIMPLSLGGPNEYWNFRLAHEDCNVIRGSCIDPKEIERRIATLFVNGVPRTPRRRRLLMTLKPTVDVPQHTDKGNPASDYDDLSVDPDRFSRLNIKDGRIYFRLYRQDGTMQPMDCADTFDNRMCVDWMQAHDRYSGDSVGTI